MSSVSEPKEQDDGLEAAVDQAIAACGGDTRAAISRADSSRTIFGSPRWRSSRRLYRTAYTRGRFRTYTG